MLKNSKLVDVFVFVGDVVSSIPRAFSRDSKFSQSDFVKTCEMAGPRALPIVCLISILVGLILAYIGALQLRTLGAQIYVANLVGLSMFREMGAVMAGIIMAGRTGASFAAELGTMEVNEETDALEVFGIHPTEHLVLPRVFGLVLTMPILCLVADVMGVLGGSLVSVGAFKIPLLQYVTQTRFALKQNDLIVGLIKSVFFGLIVALVGCYYGRRCQRSAEGVGQAVTGSVVTAIVLIVVFDAAFAVIFNLIGM
jgi:phospholipid/cholesterol/gamma-HCH transport system permease protein